MNNNINDYYKAYEKRYRQVYDKNTLWSSLKPTHEVLETINEYNISKEDNILDLGCGEGRDSIYLLDNGYNVLALDYSMTVIDKCNEITNNKYKDKFKQFDIMVDNLDKKYKFIYSIAVLHMFVLQEHRDKYLNFIYEHLDDDGTALICVLGDGIKTHSSDIEDAFEDAERTVMSSGEKINIATTSCKIIDWDNLEKEINNNNLIIDKKWISNKIPQFGFSMCVVVRKSL